MSTKFAVAASILQHQSHAVGVLVEILNGGIRGRMPENYEAGLTQELKQLIDELLDLVFETESAVNKITTGP